MWLEQLHLLHRRTGAANADTSNISHFTLQTCQRQIQVHWTSDPLDRMDDQWDYHWGAKAYEFLLRVVSGLESALVGETEIFGQFKKAWAMQASDHRQLEPLFNKLLEDTKELRTHYLQNLGQTSYGSLARRLLLENAVPSGACVLILGAGQLARAVAPFLNSQWNVGVWNRSPARAEELVANLLDKKSQSMTAHLRETTLENITDDFLSEFVAKARALVVCHPGDLPPALAGGRLPQTVIHFGENRKDLAANWFSSDCEILALDDVFARFQDSMEVRRSKIIAAAHFAQERARLRTLGPSATSVAHGWEDLAHFV